MPSTPNARQLADPASAHFRLEHSPFFLMNRLVATYGLLMGKALKKMGADVPRWRVLVVASERGPISVSALADVAVIKLSTATKVIQRLARDGLLKMERSTKDARVTEVRITAEGRRVSHLVRNTASEIFHQAFSHLTPAEIRNMNRTVKRLHENLTRHGTP